MGVFARNETVSCERWQVGPGFSAVHILAFGCSCCLQFVITNSLVLEDLISPYQHTRLHHLQRCRLGVALASSKRRSEEAVVTLVKTSDLSTRMAQSGACGQNQSPKTIRAMMIQAKKIQTRILARMRPRSNRNLSRK